MQTANINQRKLNRGGLTHVPSPPWYGAFVSALLLLSLATVFSYTLLDWRWQQEQGGWNYWFAGGVSVLFALAMRAWRNDPRRLFGAQSEADR